MQQVTFRISDLKKLIGAKETGNVLVTVDENQPATATIAPSTSAVQSASIMTAEEPVIIDGCPYPPGCTE